MERPPYGSVTNIPDRPSEMWEPLCLTKRAIWQCITLPLRSRNGGDDNKKAVSNAWDRLMPPSAQKEAPVHSHQGHSASDERREPGMDCRRS